MPDEKKVCPECGADLSNRDLYAHMLSHYPEYLDPAKSSKLAIKRQALIMAGGVTPAQYAAEHKEE